MIRKTLALLSLSVLLLAGCQKPLVSIRNPNVYTNELNYDAMEDEISASTLRHWLAANCPCDADGLWDSPHAGMCETTAKHILMLEIRGPYHRAMQEYNGSLTDERPPSEPPILPSTASLCE